MQNRFIADAENVHQLFKEINSPFVVYFLWLYEVFVGHC